MSAFSKKGGVIFGCLLVGIARGRRRLGEDYSASGSAPPDSSSDSSSDDDFPPSFDVTGWLKRYGRDTSGCMKPWEAQSGVKAKFIHPSQRSKFIKKRGLRGTYYENPETGHWQWDKPVSAMDKAKKEARKRFIKMGTSSSLLYKYEMESLYVILEDTEFGTDLVLYQFTKITENHLKEALRYEQYCDYIAEDRDWSRVLPREIGRIPYDEYEQDKEDNKKTKFTFLSVHYGSFLGTRGLVLYGRNGGEVLENGKRIQLWREIFPLKVESAGRTFCSTFFVRPDYWIWGYYDEPLNKDNKAGYWNCITGCFPDLGKKKKYHRINLEGCKYDSDIDFIIDNKDVSWCEAEDIDKFGDENEYNLLPYFAQKDQPKKPWDDLKKKYKKTDLYGHCPISECRLEERSFTSFEDTKFCKGANKKALKARKHCELKMEDLERLPLFYHYKDKPDMSRYLPQPRGESSDGESSDNSSWWNPLK